MGSCLSASAPTSPEDKYARDKNGKLKRKDSNTDMEKAAKIAKDKKAAEQKAALKASDKVSDKCPHPPRFPALPISFWAVGGTRKVPTMVVSYASRSLELVMHDESRVNPLVNDRFTVVKVGN